MKILKLSFFLFLTTLWVSCNQVEYDMFSDLTVQVIDVSTQDALSGVSVSLSPSGKNAFTGSDGTCTFQSLEAIQYTVMVQKEGYQTNRKSIALNAGEPAFISVIMKSITID